MLIFLKFCTVSWIRAYGGRARGKGSSLEAARTNVYLDCFVKNNIGACGGRLAEVVCFCFASAGKLAEVV